MRIARIVVGTASLLYLLASSSTPEHYLLALSGDRQTGTSGQLLPEPIVARLTDEAGNGVMGQSIVFDTRMGGALIDSSGIESTRLVMRTNAWGDATVAVRLAPDADTNRMVIRVSSTGAATPATFSFRGVPGSSQTADSTDKFSRKDL